MKFHQLDLNQEFMYQGKVYVKASPVLARESTTGVQKFMRRADSVEPYSSLTTPEVNETTTHDDELISKGKVKALLACFVNSCQVSIEKELKSSPSPSKNKIRSHIKQARSQFLRDLNQ